MFLFFPTEILCQSTISDYITCEFLFLRLSASALLRSASYNLALSTFIALALFFH